MENNDNRFQWFMQKLDEGEIKFITTSKGMYEVKLVEEFENGEEPAEEEDAEEPETDNLH